MGILTAILFGLGLPAVLALLYVYISDNKEKIKAPIDKVKASLSDAIERHKETNTLEYQEKMLNLLAQGYTEEQAKAILKTSMRIEQMKKKRE